MQRIVLFLTAWILTGMCSVFAQAEEESPAVANDTVPATSIQFTPASASDYINKLLRQEDLWRAHDDTMKLSLQRLMEHYTEPMDSVITRLLNFPYDSIRWTRSTVTHQDTLPVRWLNNNTFFIDTVSLGREPLIYREIIEIRNKKPDTLPVNDTLHVPGFAIVQEPVVERDTISEVLIDSLLLRERNVRLHQLLEGEITPPLLESVSNRTFRFPDDSSTVVITHYRRALVADQDSPFYILPDEEMPDSLKFAVKQLVDYTYERDSILLFVSDIEGRQTPLWLSGNKDEMRRFWVKNEARDSITLWVGNPVKNELALVLEDNVSVERRERISVDDIPITTVRPQRSLVRLQPVDEIPIFWNTGLSTAFTLNQTHFSNWARGGESSFAGNLDIRARAQYTNKETKIRWNNEGRLRYGTIRTEEHGFRTNTDNLEINSQFNTDLREKLDFSSVLYFKTQVAKGYNYPNDSVVISRFLNPGALTVGVGVEYKPFDKTSINFSPLSYRNTFVLDTAGIDQTNHGIDADRRTRQELGGQLVIRNSLSILDGLEINNAIRLFSGYLDKPQNIDVDWEINLEKQISWFFKISLNLHLIYDDDILFVVRDANNEPVLLPDGSTRRVPKTQFKQFLGLTLSFRF